MSHLKAILDMHRTNLAVDTAEFLNLYRELTPAQQVQLSEAALDLVIDNKGDWVAKEILLTLACLFPGSLSSIQLRLAECSVFTPGEMYLGADAGTRDLLLSLVDSKPFQILSALAWIGDEVVQSKFHRWRDKAPWRGQLPKQIRELDGVSLINLFTEPAGWILRGDGARKNLFYPTGYKLSREKLDSVLSTIRESTESCQWCGRSLTVLFDLDLTSSRLSFLNLEGKRLQIPMCDRCSCYGTVFVDVDFDGGFSWSSANVRPDYIGPEDEYPPYPSEVLGLGEPLLSPYETHTPIYFEVSQIGGFPGWLQEPEYPRCPDCGLPMIFLGQLSFGEIKKTSEGVQYTFICALCGKAATIYQQT